jgi:diguanylate cyclase (GGDEF)-like protein
MALRALDRMAREWGSYGSRQPSGERQPDRREGQATLKIAPALRSGLLKLLPGLRAERNIAGDLGLLVAASASLVVLLLIASPDGHAAFGKVLTIGLLLLAVGWAAYIARLCESTRSLTAARAAEQRQAAIAQFAREAISAVDLSTVLEAAATVVTRILEVEQCAIYEQQGAASDLLLPADSGQCNADCAQSGKWLRIEIGQPPAVALVAFRKAERAFANAEVDFARAIVDVVGAAVLRSRADAAGQIREAELTYRAFHDALTGLPNRALFEDRLQHAVARAQRNGTPVSLLFVDLDDFKTINDTFGHAAGDQVLFQVADRLSQCLRDGDTAARLGGDEFVLVLEGTTELEAAQVVARIEEVLQSHIRVGVHEIQVSASIGLANARREGGDAETLLRHADAAMYSIKQQTKDRASTRKPRLRRQAQSAHRSRPLWQVVS